MKISLALLGVSALAQEEASAEEATDEAVAAESVAEIGRLSYGGDYDYYYDAEGRKKKKQKGNKNNYGGNNYYGGSNNQYASNNNYGSNNYGSSNYGGYDSQATWYDNSYGGFGYDSKGSHYDMQLMGNGRFCWNCYARLHYDPETYVTSTAYDNCFAGGAHEGFMEMCVGEEYYCMWEERRHKGRIVSVAGGCKSAHSCLRQMTENFRWQVYDPGYPEAVGQTCKSGNFGDETLNSVCWWCCDAMPSNLDRYNPDNTMLCNHKDFNHGSNPSPAYTYFTDGDTDAFVWNYPHGNLENGEVNDLFNGLYKDGHFHGLFRIHDQYPLGVANLAATYPFQRPGPAYDDKLRSHPREWTGKPAMLRGHNRFGQ